MSNKKEKKTKKCIQNKVENFNGLRQILKSYLTNRGWGASNPPPSFPTRMELIKEKSKVNVFGMSYLQGLHTLCGP